MIPSPDSPPNPAPGFAGLAQKIRRRTTDLLAIGVVAVATLTIGRQTIVWWKTEPLPPVATAPGGSGFLHADDTPVVLEFGEQPVSLTRQRLQGTRAQALAKLADLCRTACDAATSPPLEVAAVESTLREAVHDQQPFEELTNHWRLYQLDDGLPMIVGFRHFPPGLNEPHPDNRSRTEVPNTAPFPSDRWRLVCWGLAMPLSSQTWTLYTHGAATISSVASNSIGTTPAIPPGSQRILSLRQEGGGGMIGFRGPGPITDWRAFYDRWAREHGWKKLPGAQISIHSYAVRFQAEASVESATMDVQLIADQAGEIRGLISIWPGLP